MTQRDVPFELLERIFHSPPRLAIVTNLLDAPHGMPFPELRDRCSLTDGNLNRHVRSLAQEGIVEIDKRFVGNYPRTTITLSSEGRERFLEYLGVLEAVLHDAARRLGTRMAKADAPAAEGLGLAKA
ncbi:MAG: transcriptional regulator [Candidatus Eisenbacteria bacterium]|jgi:DNA-binding transcriptional ArsR family regulator|nr:transcriptional regulator [Candidatus Eisenbacteria bacterium]